MTYLDDNRVMVFEHSRFMYILNLGNLTAGWQRPQRQLFFSRSGAAGNFLSPLDGKRHILSLGSEIPRVVDKSQIFNSTTLRWRQGPDLPFSIQSSATVQLEDTFLLVGAAGFRTEILQFNPATETFIVRPEKLERGRDRAAAVLVPEEFLDCN